MGADYIDNQEFEEEISRWRESSENPRERCISDRLRDMLILLHERILRNRAYIAYPAALKKEMMAHSLSAIIRHGLASFVPGRARAFSYFTRAVIVNFIKIISRYYRITSHYGLTYVPDSITAIDAGGDPHMEEEFRKFGLKEHRGKYFNWRGVPDETRG